VLELREEAAFVVGAGLSERPIFARTSSGSARAGMGGRGLRASTSKYAIDLKPVLDT